MKILLFQKKNLQNIRNNINKFNAVEKDNQ